MPAADIAGAIRKVIGDVFGSLAIVIVTGAMLGKLVVESGAAQRIAEWCDAESLGFRPILLASHRVTYDAVMRKSLAFIMFALAGCAPGAFPNQDKPAPQPVQQSAKPAPIKTRQTLGKTTQNVLELSKALEQGGVLAEMSITSDGLEVASEAYRTQVGKAGSLAVEQRMQHYNAEHGEYPKTYDQFMTRIIGKGGPDSIALPMLPYYQEWAYDVANRRLVVVEFPAKKEQRQQETTGAAGL